MLTVLSKRFTPNVSLSYVYGFLFVRFKLYSVTNAADDNYLRNYSFVAILLFQLSCFSFLSAMKLPVVCLVHVNTTYNVTK